MAIRINRKFLVIVGVIVFLALAAGGIWMGLRIGKEEEVTPDPSEAGQGILEEPNCCYNAAWCRSRGASEAPCCCSDPPNTPNCIATWEQGYDACHVYQECEMAGCCIPDGDPCTDGNKCCSKVCNDSGVCGELDLKCWCDSYTGCGTNCRFPGFSCPTGYMAYCGDTTNPTCRPLDSSNPCYDVCKDTCDGRGSCRHPSHIKVYSGLDASQCVGTSYSDTFSIDCPACSNPVGCIICCNIPDEPPPPGDPYCGDNICNQPWEMCDRDQMCKPPPPGMTVVCRDNCTYCGDGNLDPGEQCEYGDPPGASCTWDACNKSTCACPTQEHNVRIMGRAYCQDPGGRLYPVAGARFNFYRGGSGSNELMVSDAEGYFMSSLTPESEGGFAVRYESLPGGELYPGWEMSNLVGPYIDTGMCCASGCPCGTPENPSCTSNYEWCVNLLRDQMTYGFNFQFQNCSDELPPEGWEFVKVGYPVCYEENTENVYVEIEYALTLINTSGGGGVNYIEDYYESKFGPSMIISTSPTATEITDEKIVWIIDDSWEEGESRTFAYVVRADKSFIGEVAFNEAVANVGEPPGNNLYASEDLFILCGLPRSAIFSDTRTRIILGGTLLLIGIASYKLGLFEQSLSWAGGVGRTARSIWKKNLSPEAGRQRWEKRIVKNMSKKRNRRK